MILIDQKSLAKVWEEKAGKADLELYKSTYKDAVGWELHVITADGRAQLVNAKGEIRYWRQLNSAAKELAELLPNLRSFLVVLGERDGHVVHFQK